MEWVALVAAAVVVGISKTSFGALASVSVALMALAMPTKESTAATLLLLITGDVVAVLRYRRSADWRMLRGLLGFVVPGLVVGVGFLAAVDDLVLRRTLGVILVLFVLLQLVLTLMGRAGHSGETAVPHRMLTAGAGIAAGFTTMTANAGGPVMALYLQLARVDKMRFLGTSAWYFLIVNLVKAPFSAALGLFTGRVLATWIVLIPAVLAGTLIGIMLIRRVPQRAFDVITLATSAVSAGALIVL